LHNYHDTHGVLPPGVSAPNGFASSNGEQRGVWGWAAFILPQLEQAALYSQIDPSANMLWDLVGLPTNDPRYIALQQPYPVFRCPSDFGPVVNTYSERDVRNSQQTGDTDLSLSNYVGVNNFRFMVVDTASGASGPFSVNSRVGFRDILDGTSNIIMVGERAWQVESAFAGVIDAKAANVFGTSGTSNVAFGLACVLAAARTRINCPAGITDHCQMSLSSRHLGGIQVIMGDGGVRFISENIQHNEDPQNNTSLERLLSISDGVVVGDY
jgi:hypothetical protein